MREIYNLYDKPKNPLNYVAVRISLASPEKIRSWSHGEVKARDHQLSDLQTGARRSLLRKNFRSSKGL